MKMTKISGINFSQKTVENVEICGNDVKEIKCEFLENTFRLTIIKNDDEVVQEVFEEETIVEQSDEVLGTLI